MYNSVYCDICDDYVPVDDEDNLRVACSYTECPFGACTDYAGELNFNEDAESEQFVSAVEDSYERT